MQLKYKDYIAEVNFNTVNKCYCGRVIEITDVLGFSGSTIEEAEQDFKQTVEEYLQWAKDEGFVPQVSKPN